LGKMEPDVSKQLLYQQKKKGDIREGPRLKSRSEGTGAKKSVLGVDAVECRHFRWPGGKQATHWQWQKVPQESAQCNALRTDSSLRAVMFYEETADRKPVVPGGAAKS